MTNLAYPLGDSIGSVELLDFMGSDLTVVNAARVSYAKHSDDLTDRDKKLIGYLMRNKHGGPFETVLFQFRVKAPLFVVHQWQRHRVASYNEQSGRYTEFEPEFYIPSDDPGHLMKYESEAMFSQYGYILGRGTSKERARLILPLSLYTSFWFTVNARSLLNFLMLRNDEHAQEEIRLYAAAIEAMFAEVLPTVHQVFVENRRVAP